MNEGYQNQLLRNSVEENKHYLILFLLWPFGALIAALINYSQKEAKKVVYIFLIYYGLTFVNNDPTIDAYKYASNLQYHALLPFSDFFKIVGGLYTDTSVDIVEPLISFIVSRFTSHYAVYFAIWAAIFGFFYLKSINLLYDRYQEKPGWNSKILMVFFIMVLPITSVSGVRMWTAAWIFFYGAYNVVLFRNPRYLILALSSSLVHWSFISANAILLIYYIAGNRNRIYIPFVLASFVLPGLIAPVYQSIAMKLGGGIQQRYSNYSSEGYISEISEGAAQSAWFMNVGSKMVFYYLIFSIIVIQFKHGNLMKGKTERNLFSFLLLFLAFVNFGMSIPSFGERFMVPFFLFATLYLFFYYLKLPGDKIYFLMVVGLFPMLLYAAINFRIGAESISAWLLTPGFGLPLLIPGLSIADFLFN